jgi:N-acetylglucosamine malate deacetylase 1
MKVLIVAAHPDDETIGCGGTIAKHVAAGDKVFLLIMTQIYAPEWNVKELERRKSEAWKAAKVLGIKGVYYGGFPTVKLNTVPTISLTGKIGEIVKKVKPQLVYIPPKDDINIDHDIVHRAACVACRPFADSSITTVLSYEIAPTTRYNTDSHSAFVPNYYTDISRFLKIKLRAMAKYRLELRNYPHPRSLKGLELFARERGLAVGFDYAEAFSLVINRS